MQRSRRGEALQLAHKGQGVYKLVPLDGKRPIVDDWVNKASSDRNYVGHTWTKHPDANIGIATGGTLVVLDMDPRNGGEESLAKLERKIGPLPAPTVLTGGGGKHWYFLVDDPVSTRKLLPGLDLRGEGAQVVAPPSIHPDTGRLYTFVNGSLPEVCPPRLAKYITRKNDSDPGTSRESSTSDFLAEGSRNENLTRLAGSMRRLGASQHEIETALIALAKESGLPVREAIRTAASIARKPSGTEEEVAKLVHHMDVRDEAHRRRRQRDIKLVELPQDSLKSDLKRPREPTTFMVHGLHPTGGNTLFIAQRKAGKTTVSMNLVKCLADRQSFLGEFDVKAPKGRIGYLNYELNEGQCLQWFEDMSIDHQSRISVMNLRGKPGCLWIDENLERFVSWLRSRRISTLVIDPAGRAWRGVVEDENSNSQVREFTSILDEVKDQGGVTDLVLVHHIGKSHRDEGTERGRGASALEDWPDAIWVLTKDEGGVRSFSAEGRDVELEPHDLDYDHQSRSLILCGTRAVRRQQDKAIVDSVRAEGDLKMLCEIVKKLGGKTTRTEILARAPWGDKKNRQLIVEGESQGLLRLSAGPRSAVIVELKVSDAQGDA